MPSIQIAVVVGSLRKDSFNRKLSVALAKLLPSDFTFKTVAAIESFQKDHNIVPDGIVRDQTYKTLLNYR